MSDGTEEFDLVLISVDLAGGPDGGETARRILSVTELPVVFMTPTPESNAVERTRGISRYGYVPLDAGELLLIETVRIALETFASHKELERRENRFRTYVENAPYGIFIADNEGRYVDVNEAACRVTGYSRDELLSRKLIDLIPEDYHPDVRAASRRIDRDGRAAVDIGFLTRNGKLRFWTVNTVRLPDSGYMGITLDITELKRTREELAQNEARYRSLIDNSPFAIAEIDVNETVITANPAMADSLGTTVEELEGRTLKELIPPEIYEARAEFARQALREERPVEFEDERAGRFFHSIIVPNLSASRPRAQVIAMDITERRRVHEELRLKDYAVSSALTAIAFADLDGTLTYVNDAFLELWGYQDEESVLGRSVLDFWVEPSEAQEVVKHVRTQGNWRGELVATKADGTPVYTQLVANMILDADARPRALMASFLDVTEAKAYQAELERRREEATEAAKAAEEANRAKSEFVANMSHEIRTPLNSVIGFTDLLLETGLDELQREYMQNIGSAAETLRDLVNDILDFSRIEAGRLDLNYSATDFVEFIERTTELVRYAAHSRGLELLLDIDPTVPSTVLIDPVRLRQVLTNLLSNAVKFTEEGEIELAVRMTEAGTDRKAVRISVRDTGIGISPQNRQAVFDVFSQVDASSTRRYGGTGLGLAISNRLLEMMDSDLELESTPGEGSTFSFLLPLTVVEPASAFTDRFESIDTALIVDDNENNRTIMAHMLAHWGISSETAAGASEALQLLKRNRFDVLLIDYQMPLVDGLELVRLVREELALPPSTQPIIILTSSTEVAVLLEQSEQLGVAVRLTKPVKMTQLHEALEWLTSKDPEHAVESRERKTVATLVGDDPAPLAAPPAAPAPTPPAVTANKASGAPTRYKILIAEDNPVNYKLAATIIERNAENIELVHAADGAQAVELYQTESPDLVFMDLHMPCKDGYAATSEIRALSRDSGGYVPIVALTAAADTGQRERCFSAGMDGYLTKPFTQKDIMGTIEKWLGLPFADPNDLTGPTAPRIPLNFSNP
ncbi:MAG: PAS domain S-box protein [Spirochaetaceae bacterium]